MTFTLLRASLLVRPTRSPGEAPCSTNYTPVLRGHDVPFPGRSNRKFNGQRPARDRASPHAGPLPARLLWRFPVQTALYGVVHGVQDEPDQEEYPHPQEDL